MIGFVIGHPRSGTRLLAELLAIGGGQASHELLWHLRPRIVGEATRYYRGESTAGLIDSLLSAYEDERFSIDCNWKLSWILPPLLERYPRARIVHLIRDPGENIRSCFNLDYYGILSEQRRIERDRQRDYWLKWMPPIARPDWSSLDAFEKNCVFWDETHRLIQSQAGDRAFRVNLETLPSQVESLFDFLSLPLPRRDLVDRVLSMRFNEKAEEKQLVEVGRGYLLGPSSDWPLERRASLARICGARAEALGYRVK